MSSREPPDPGGGRGIDDDVTMTVDSCSPPLFTQTARKRGLTEEENVQPVKKTVIVASENTTQVSQNSTNVSLYLNPVFTLVRRYGPSDKGPFLVHISREEAGPASGTTIRPIVFGQFLYEKEIKNIVLDGVKNIGRNRISVEFKSATDANQFLSHPALASSKYLASIPTYNITRVGVVRDIPADWSMEEFVKAVEVPANCGDIIKARRINRKSLLEGVVEWVPTRTVVLTFSGQFLPAHLYCYYNSLKVEPYVFPTIQCKNCCHFGHIKSQCRSKPRCFRCAQPHPGESCDEVATCLLCSGNHVATYDKCPEHIRQKNIKMIMSQEAISFKEASSRLPSVRRSYADSSLNNSARAQLSPEGSAPTPQSIQHRKTVTTNRSPRSPAAMGGFDRESHQAIISTPQSSLENGCALRERSPSPQNDNFIDILISLLLNILLKYDDCSLPTNVAQKLAKLVDIYNNKNDSNNSVELP